MEIRYRVLALVASGDHVEIGDGTGMIPARGDIIRAELSDGLWELVVYRRVFVAREMIWEVCVKRDRPVPVPVTP